MQIDYPEVSQAIYSSRTFKKKKYFLTRETIPEGIKLGDTADKENSAISYLACLVLIRNYFFLVGLSMCLRLTKRGFKKISGWRCQQKP
jgi:hypothetical protein